MKKREYIEKLENLIVNRVSFHAPIVRDKEVDYSLLKALNIEIKYPIFVYKKPLDKVFFQAFLRAKKRCDFNLILTAKPLISYKQISQMKDTHIFLEEEIGSNLFNILNTLNINYSSTLNFNLKRTEEYFRLNNQDINFDFVPFYNNKKLMFNGVIGQVKQFLLNGKNYTLELVNTRDCQNEIDFELNIPLPQGYYIFKKSFDHIEINNLTTKEKFYFNYFVKDAKVEFSCIEGIESCSFACINMKGKLWLKGRQKKSIFFNLGQERFNLISQKDISTFFDESQREMFEIFNVRALSKDGLFDDKFNNALPKKIWDSWNRFSYDQVSEEKWLEMRGRLIKDTDVGVEINEKDIPLKEVKIFKNGIWKRIFVMYGDSRYLFAGKIKYYNFTILTKEIFDKNNEIYLSFAS
ncbi:MAG: hypothetical protein IJX25_03015 [Clostridia bacterium]|nr:hypothetical protein [Clostridia bacterium]